MDQDFLIRELKTAQGFDSVTKIHVGGRLLGAVLDDAAAALANAASVPTSRCDHGAVLFEIGEIVGRLRERGNGWNPCAAAYDEIATDIERAIVRVRK